MPPCFTKNRIGPFSPDIVGPHVEVPAVAHVGGHHVEPAVMAAQRGRVDAAGSAAFRQLSWLFRVST